jgi:hypothetical protein
VITGVKITKDNTKEFYKAVSALTKNRVLVGIPADLGDVRPDNGPNNATIGYAMEFGVPELNIPARPALIPGVNNVLKQVSNLLKEAGKKVLEADFDAVTRAFNRIGLLAQSSVKNKIRTGPFAPLSERTLAARRAKGNFSEKPLIDTSSYLNSITYVVTDK